MIRVNTGFIFWFFGSAIWVLVCTFNMSVNAPKPKIVEALSQTHEPAGSAARKMWEEHDREIFAHLAKWTGIGFVPPLLALLAGLLLIKATRGRLTGSGNSEETGNTVDGSC